MPVLVTSLAASHTLGGFTLFPTLEAIKESSSNSGGGDDDMLLAPRLMMRWLPLNPLSLVTKRGSSFVYESSHVVKGRASIGIN